MNLLDPANIQYRADLPCSFRPMFELSGFPTKKVVPKRSPDDELWWYTRDVPLNGVIVIDPSIDFYAPCDLPFQSKHGTPHCTNTDNVGNKIGLPFSMWISMWCLDRQPVISIYSVGHEEYYILLKQVWDPPTTSVFKGLDGEQIKLTFHGK